MRIVPTVRIKAALAAVGAAVVAGVAMVGGSHGAQNAGMTSASSSSTSTPASTSGSTSAATASSGGSPTTAASPAATPSGTAAPGSVVIVLDTSRSMRTTTANGTTRMEEAKRAVDALVDSLPPSTKVGLRVYGSTVPVGDPQSPSAEACRDSRQVLPVAPLDRTRVKTVVDLFSPAGYGPTSYALEQAAADLPTSGDRSIVLLSDGSDSCAGDPTDTARRLRAQTPGLTISTVGLHTDQPASRQLASVASAGGGRYTRATTTGEAQAGLAQALGAPTSGSTPDGATADGTAGGDGSTAAAGATNGTTSGTTGSTNDDTTGDTGNGATGGTTNRTTNGTTNRSTGSGGTAGTSSADGAAGSGSGGGAGAPSDGRTLAGSPYRPPTNTGTSSPAVGSTNESVHPVTSDDPRANGNLPVGFVSALLLVALFFWLKDH